MFPYRAGVYDLVVIINVLEHCMDALQVLQNAHDAVKPGTGILVIHDRYSDHLWRDFFSPPPPPSSSPSHPPHSASSSGGDGGHNAATSAVVLKRRRGETPAKKNGDPFWDVGHPLNLLQAPFLRLFEQYSVLWEKEGGGGRGARVFHYIGRKKEEGGVRRSSDGRSGGAGQRRGGGPGVGSERGVVEQGPGDRDVPRGDRRADVVAVKEGGEREFFFQQERGGGVSERNQERVSETTARHDRRRQKILANFELPRVHCIILILIQGTLHDSNKIFVF